MPHIVYLPFDKVHRLVGVHQVVCVKDAVEQSSALKNTNATRKWIYSILSNWVFFLKAAGRSKLLDILPLWSTLDIFFWVNNAKTMGEKAWQPQLWTDHFHQMHPFLTYNCHFVHLVAHSQNVPHKTNTLSHHHLKIPVLFFCLLGLDVRPVGQRWVWTLHDTDTRWAHSNDIALASHSNEAKNGELWIL